MTTINPLNGVGFNTCYLNNQCLFPCLGDHVIVFGLFVACGNTKEVVDSSDFQSGNNEIPNGLLDLNPEILFTVPNRPWDVSQHPDGRIFCSAQTGGNLYAWNPISQEREDINGDFDGILAIGFQNDTFVYTTTEDTNTGALVHHDFDTGTNTVLTTQSSDGTLFRWPIDITAGPENSWFVADYNAQTVFHVDSTGLTNTIDSGSSRPTTVLFRDNVLYTGGEDGVFAHTLNSNSPIKMDDRTASGLSVVENKLIATGNPHGLFLVEGSTIEFEGPARHGAMLYNGYDLIITDHTGEGVWQATP